ncbi:hypothetical protein [Phenylobacterium sp.]|uniref:hypothetical protein n=1 Tax=Phenylobacterium sp. TaxID=1871053 RepID=UPI0027305E32|nr:hypothetical protein [Phenylobacterium sp.]MDP1617312.1 hypothetical protein [Phenylobacterium sp.]MDP1985684.1 hypothetical protein [Phenylobacterium sp.]
MKPLAAVRRWRTFLGAVHGPWRPPEIRRRPDQVRTAQMAAARAAFLSNQTPAQRQLGGPTYGDTQ